MKKIIIKTSEFRNMYAGHLQYKGLESIMTKGYHEFHEPSLSGFIKFCRPFYKDKKFKIIHDNTI